jgi:hypothetical protein
MPRYAPLPSVSIDPRNEAELVQAASQRVYQASNQTLNDFSSGNPLAALLEGQVFAQGEFLFWANQLPEKILLEWIGPFLGAMRRLGTASLARLVLTIPPSNSPVTIPSGSSFTTDPNITGGQVYSFLTAENYTFSPGETVIYVPVFSEFVGSLYNVPANSIVGSSAINVAGLSAINPEPATGGSDVETYQEVQERFFTLIRRKNPVSAQDWQDFFIDFYGVGTQTSVQPNRGSEFSYNYLTDYILPSGQVSFFVLGPGGVELTEEQLSRGQNVVNFSVPIGTTGHLYPLTLSQVQYDITLEVDANSSFGVNLRNSSLNFRDRLFQLLQPGNVFPSSTDPSVSDVDSAFYATFDADTRYVNPRIVTAKAYNTPPQLGPSAALYTQVYAFDPSEQLLNQNDLVLETIPTTSYYPVLTSFTPYSAEKKDQTIYGNLVMRQIQLLQAGSYNQGDVVYWSPASGGDGKLRVILDNINIGSLAEIPLLVAVGGKISGEKTYSPWVVGNSYVSNLGGSYNPDIVEYDYVPGDGQFVPETPQELLIGPISALGTITPGLGYTDGNYTNVPFVNTTGFGVGATANITVSGGVVTAVTLIFPGEGYTPGSILTAADSNLGNSGVGAGFSIPVTAVTVPRIGSLVWVVDQNFTLQAPSNSTTSALSAGLLGSSVVPNSLVPGNSYLSGTWVTTPQIGSGPNAVADPYYNYVDPLKGGVNKFAHVLQGFVYEPNDLAVKEYFDLLVELGIIQEIVVQNADLGLPVYKYKPRFPVGTYLEYKESSVSAPQYFVATQYFTPDSTLINDLLDQNLVLPLAYTPSQVVSLAESINNGTVKTPQRMFRFFKGDTTFFRQGSQILSYTATTNVTPLFDFSVYFENQVFVPSADVADSALLTLPYIPYFNPDYSLFSEDTIVSEDGRNLYRVMRAFSPVPTVTDWTNTTVVNTTRIEEYEGNLLRYVNAYTCDEQIKSQFGRDISAIKLGIASITLIPKNGGRFSNASAPYLYVWENASTSTEVPQLSWLTGTTYPYSPPNYRNGTMGL